MPSPTPHNSSDKKPSNALTVTPSGRALTQPEALLEELQIVRLEGRLFCFNKHEAKNRKGVLEYRDGNRGIIIEVSQRFGHPSILAYKVLQAVFRKITLEGKPYPDRVSFTARELAKMVGRDRSESASSAQAEFGGQDAKQLHQAIGQLRNTSVELQLYEDDGKKSFKSLSFNLLSNTGFIGEGSATSPTKITAVVLQLDPLIAENMRQGKFAIFNWGRLGDMSPLAAALYKRLYYHLSNLYEKAYDKGTLKFEKDYEAICAEWLGGLKPEKYKSRIMYQLGEHFETLRQCGLIRTATIEPKSVGEGFKIVFRPATGFFEDYELFYAGGRTRKLQFQHASDQAAFHVPIDMVAHFYKRLHKVDSVDGQVFTPRDIEYAQSLQERIGEEGMRDLIEYVMEEAPKTKFDIKNIKALDGYLAAWQIERSKREEAVKRRAIEDKAKQQARLQEDYERFCEQERFQYLEGLSPEERQNLKAQALSLIQEKSPAGSVHHKIMLGVTERKLAADRLKLPTFEEWFAART